MWWRPLITRRGPHGAHAPSAQGLATGKANGCWLACASTVGASGPPCGLYVKRSMVCPRRSLFWDSLSCYRERCHGFPRPLRFSSGTSWPQRVLRSPSSLALIGGRWWGPFFDPFKLRNKFVYVRRGGNGPLLATPSRPFEVVTSGPKYFSVRTGVRVGTASIDRLKPHQGQEPPTVAEAAKQGRPQKRPPLVLSLVALSWVGPMWRPEICQEDIVLIRVRCIYFAPNIVSTTLPVITSISSSQSGIFHCS
jgi:hypothetical protein